MNSYRRQAISVLLGASLLFLLLLVVTLDSAFLPEPPETFLLREVQVYTPPPPPPPPPFTTENSRLDFSSEVNVALQRNQLELEVMDLELEVMDLEVELEAGQLGNMGSGLSGLAGSSGMEWGTVGLSELDQQPYVTSAPPFIFPAELLDKGVNEFTVVFHIIIDEEGRIYPIKVLETSYPTYNQELLEYIEDFRFSPPTRLGVPVRLEYRWPMIFTSE